MVVHLAGMPQKVKDSDTDSLVEYRRVNVTGTERLAEKSAASGVKRFIFMSSVKVCGEGKQEPYKEEDKQMPAGPYSLSKYEAEQKLHEIAAKTRMEVVVIRPPLVYGPGVKANFLNLLKIVSRGIPLPFASINNSRSFIYLGNLIDAVMTCMVHPRAAGNTYLVSDDEDLSTPRLILKIAEAIGKSGRLFFFPPNLLRLIARLIGKTDSLNRLQNSLSVDISKICSDLDWRPCHSVDEGVTATAQWFLKEFRKN
jgi:nucleoside-diphosphate-sugar epimerase